MQTTTKSHHRNASERTKHDFTVMTFRRCLRHAVKLVIRNLYLRFDAFRDATKAGAKQDRDLRFQFAVLANLSSEGGKLFVQGHIGIRCGDGSAGCSRTLIRAQVRR